MSKSAPDFVTQLPTVPVKVIALDKITCAKEYVVPTTAAFKLPIVPAVAPAVNCA